MRTGRSTLSVRSALSSRQEFPMIRNTIDSIRRFIDALFTDGLPPQINSKIDMAPGRLIQTRILFNPMKKYV